MQTLVFWVKVLGVCPSIQTLPLLALSFFVRSILLHHLFQSSKTDTDSCTKQVHYDVHCASFPVGVVIPVTPKGCVNFW